LYQTDVIESVSVFEDNVNISTRENLGTNAKTGFEFNAKYRIAKWVTAMGDFNYGYFVRRGEFDGQSFDFEGDQWSTQVQFKFDLPLDIDIEWTPQYESRVVTVQGVQSGFFYMDAGIRKKLWSGKAVINLGVRDILASRIRESIVDQNDFYLYSFSQRGRFVTLGFSYSFGKGEAVSYTGRR
jgi:hypothetical protein